MRLRFRGRTYYGKSYTPPIEERVPRLTIGLELQGEYQGSGSVKPQYLARRGDGQVLQMSQLLYLVASEIDGQRNLAEIAHRVTGQFGRTVSPKNVDYLVENQLRPLGVVSDGESDEVDKRAPRSDLLLGLVGRRVLIPQRSVIRVARVLSWLHLPWVVVLVLAGQVALDVWLFGQSKAIPALISVMTDPRALLISTALTVVSILFHEFGHASACHHSGARPGNIGVGLYVIWPAMYTDVTDVYRVKRAGRLRTDFGGVYFNIIFILVMAGCYAATGLELFLATAFFIHFEILEQLLPIVRLDGYFILGDLAGVPDLFGKVRPILLSVLRPGRPDPRVAGLKRGTRIVVTVWTMIVFPLIGVNLLYALWNLPRILRATARTVTDQGQQILAAWDSGQYASLSMGVFSFVFLVLPSFGLLYVLIRMIMQGIRRAVFSTVGRPVLRIALLGAGGLAGGAMVAVWCVVGL